MAAFDLQAALAQIAADPTHSGFGSGWEEGTGENAVYHSSVPVDRTGGVYFYGGKAIKPNGDGTYLVYTPAEPGHASKLNGTTADIMDSTGNVVGQEQFRNISDNSSTRNLVGMASILALPFAAAAMGVGAAGGAAGAGAGAGTAGAGFVGDATAAGYAGLDAAGTASLGGGASGAWGGGLGALGEAGAAGAGAGFLGDATAAGYGGLDAASTTTMGGGASGAWGGGAAAGGGAIGGGGGGFTTPTAPGYGAPSTLGSMAQDALGAMGGAGGAGGGFNWGSLVGPALSAVGGIAGAKAAGSAADAQLQATREAAALQEPFRQGGMAAMNRLLELNGIGGNPASEGYGSAQKDFTAADFAAGMDPGYEWRKQQGQLGLERAASAGKGGGIGSGGYLKDAMAYNSGIASQEFGNAYNRYQTNRTAKLNPLQSLMGAGQTAANTIGGYTVDGGNAKAAGTVGQANALTSAIGQGWSMYQNNQQQSQNNALMNALLMKGM